MLLWASIALAQTSTVQITNAWARGTPGGAETGAIYLTLESPSGDKLVGVSTPVAKKADMHMMTMENGVMKMRPLDGVDLPPGKPTTLKPGGMHIMLMGLRHPLKAGQSFPMTLKFAKSGTREVQVEVEKPGAMAPMHQAGSTNMNMPTNH
jgi:copper(I)-binding protein